MPASLDITPPEDSGFTPEAEAVIEDRRSILSRRRLLVALAEIAERQPAGPEQRSSVLALLKGALSDGRAEVRRRFDEGASGTATVRAESYLVDQLMRVIYDHVGQRLYPLANPSTGERLCLVAVGGYGRGELAPQSDIDLLFLLPYKLTPRSEQVVEEVLYFLWDLGFKVGHATRSVAECLRLAKADTTICTALLEARWLWGDQDLFRELRQRFAKDVQAGGGARFIEAKLTERATRHKRFGGSRYSLEPNIKEGKGGLRDLHTLFWIAKFLYNVDDIAKLVERKVFTGAEVRRFEKAQNFLWTLRCHMHYRAARADERLTFDMQKDLAPLMGFTAHAGLMDVERFMKRYFLVAKEVGDLTRIFCAAIEAEHDRRSRFRLPSLRRRRKIDGFGLERDRLTVTSGEVFAEKPIEMLRIFRVAQKHELDIHPQALRWITQNLKRVNKALREDPAANELFMEMLASKHDPETTLRRLNEAGVFGRFLPDFGRVVAQMQYNMYHHYTVDEHTIFAIGILHAIEQGSLANEAPIASEVVHKVLSRRVLYMAVLLHDIAKGRQGDHSLLGAKVASKVCPRFGLSAGQTETVAWLVLHHLAMSDTAFKRDIDDPKTLQDFADLVQSPERLRLLLVLTVADIRAVGPGVWNAWKAALLRDLYWRTEALLSGGLAAQSRDARVKGAKDILKEKLQESGWSTKDIAAHLRRGYPAYWSGLDVEIHLRHARLVREAENNAAPLTIDTRVDRYREATEVTIYAADHPGLFSRIAGAMAVAGASITAARIFTLRNGMALDSFFVEGANGGPFDQPGKLARLSAAIEQCLAGRLRPLQELEAQKSPIPSRLRVFKVSPQVLVDNKASRNHTVIEVNGRDRPGLLYQVTQALTKLNLIVKAARIATFGERAVDVFYVQDALGGKIDNKVRLENIEKKLLAALEDGDCIPAKKAAKAVTAKSPAKPQSRSLAKVVPKDGPKLAKTGPKPVRGSR
ncbi:[protein-PII] uridylyltransferase [Pelagibius litoralis]|uniref:Bifunctional uridylyltransferase/uridylyl-removing enzyme n=1 Tax=Pelagibius litoralis TaxID=374515 RepID=A0A967F2S7_9PROT|nr:[protein-PII] uridylyltransferase [Pelagibius litoralis]NIA71963.1 [protein-PII] uridylyltransferase [Pelagibius litoralis]